MSTQIVAEISMMGISCIFLRFLSFCPVPFLRVLGCHRVHGPGKFKEHTFLVCSIKGHSVRLAGKEREDLGLGKCYAEFKSMELNLFV